GPPERRSANRPDRGYLPRPDPAGPVRPHAGVRTGRDFHPRRIGVHADASPGRRTPPPRPPRHDPGHLRGADNPGKGHSADAAALRAAGGPRANRASDRGQGRARNPVPTWGGPGRPRAGDRWPRGALLSFLSPEAEMHRTFRNTVVILLAGFTSLALAGPGR